LLAFFFTKLGRHPVPFIRCPNSLTLGPPSRFPVGVFTSVFSRVFVSRVHSRHSGIRQVSHLHCTSETLFLCESDSFPPSPPEGSVGGNTFSFRNWTPRGWGLRPPFILPPQNEAVSPQDPKPHSISMPLPHSERPYSGFPPASLLCEDLCSTTASAQTDPSARLSLCPPAREFDSLRSARRATFFVASPSIRKRHNNAFSFWLATHLPAFCPHKGNF